MKTSKRFFFLILFFSIFILIPMSSFSPHVSASENIAYISATDILKNFKFETIGGEPIVDEGAFNNKLRFDTQASWILYKNDVYTLDTIEDGGETYLKYRIVLRNKINFYTNVRINQMAQNLIERSTDYLGMEYLHKSIENNVQEHWYEYITWEHWDFGDIYNWNWQNNYFSGRVAMSFDIDDNPVPDTFGSYATKNFDYIAVSDAGIINNIHGLMSTDMPDIVVLDPSEEEIKEKEPATWELGPLQHSDNDYAVQIFPNVNLFVPDIPIQSFDSSILPDTKGSSLGPTNKDGTPTWDPEIEEKSMTGCMIYYDLSAISPVVYKYEGILTYNEYYLHTEHEYTENFWDGWATFVDEKSFYWHPRVKYNDVALHGINRYLQTDIYVAFDIWTSVNIGTLTDYYENMKLEAPEEYYDALIWSTLAGGWTGSEIREGGDPGIEFFNFDWLTDFFGSIGNIITIVIIIAVIGIGVYIFLVIRKQSFRRRKRK